MVIVPLLLSTLFNVEPSTGAESSATFPNCRILHFGAAFGSRDKPMRACEFELRSQPTPTIMRLRTFTASVVLCTAFTFVSYPSPSRISSTRMADGKEWLTQNLDIKTAPSFCYGDSELNCGQYGRLYTWESAGRACQSLSNGWRLPTDDEWRHMAKLYGGVSMDSADKGKDAYKALLTGGSSGFNALLGGGRSPDGQYARLEAHGFYWTASETDKTSGLFYNFGKGGQALHRQSGGDKQQAFSVRCVRE